MRKRMLQLIVPILAILAAGSVAAQITSNPIPAPIEKRGLAVEIVEVARLPDTRGIRAADQDVKPAGWARVNYVRDLPDGRRFANDSPDWCGSSCNAVILAQAGIWFVQTCEASESDPADRHTY